MPVVLQHSDDVTFSWLLRDLAILSPHFTLADLAQLDSRTEADLDGLRIAGSVGWELCRQCLQSKDPGGAFAASVLALESGDPARLSDVLKEASHAHGAEQGLLSAVGWVAADYVDGWRHSMLQSTKVFNVRVNIAGLAIRRIDIGSELERGLGSRDFPTVARTLRAIGETKYCSALKRVREHLHTDDEQCRFWAAWSSVLLGEKASAESLKTFVNFNTSVAYRAIQLAPRVLETANAQRWLRGLAQDETTRRFALIGCGVTGDPVYIPTLISQMSVPEQARVAGEAFSMITGVDLAYEDLDIDWPEGFEAGPTEDPADENVDLDPDEDLPWPNQQLIEKWWQEHGRAFQPGVRYLCGQPISRENCRRVLIEGYQRQRIAASLELALLNPDEPLFEWRAPGWRQQEWLGLRKPRRNLS